MQDREVQAHGEDAEAARSVAGAGAPDAASAGDPASANDAAREIEEHRAVIDDIDKQLVRLINERSRQSLIIRKLKYSSDLPVLDAAREERILGKVCAYNNGPFTDENMRELYAAMLKIMKEVPFPDDL